MTWAVLRGLAAVTATVVTAAMFTTVSVSVDIATATHAAALPVEQIRDTPTGDVFAIDVVDGVSYLGGAFTGVGANTGGGALVDPSTGTVDRSFAGVRGTVAAVVDDGAGGVYIGGTFAAVGGVPRRGVAHIRADGTLDPVWKPTVQGEVRAMALAGSTLYIGGRFTYVNGNVERRNAAALDVASGTATPWSPNLSHPVNAIAVSGPSVYLGGEFTTVNGGVTRNFAAAVNATTGAATPWDPDPSWFVTAMDVSGPNVYLGGAFSSLKGGTVRNGAAAVDSTTGAPTAWDPQLTCSGLSYPNMCIIDVTVAGSQVYLAGGIITVNGGTARRNVVSVDMNTAIATAWNPDPDGYVHSVTPAGPLVFLGGDFTSINGTTSRLRSAAVDATTGAATGWDPRASSTVKAIAPTGDKMYLGGLQTHVNVVQRRAAAAIDSTGRVTEWNPDVDRPINTLRVVNGTVYVGGEFTAVNGTTPRQHAAALDAATGIATPWNPTLDGSVHTLLVSGDTVYLGGAFTTANGATARNRAAAVDLTVGTAKAWNPDVGGDVYALAASGSTVFVGGWFSQINGDIPREGVAAVDAISGGALNWDAKLDSTVTTLAVRGSALYLGGWFSTVNSTVKRGGAAAVSISTAVATQWDPGLLHSGMGAIAFSGNTAYLGGSFFYANGSMTRRYGAAVDATTGRATSWNPDFNGPVRALVATQSTVYAAGGFSDAVNNAQVSPSGYFAALNPSSETASQFVPIAPVRAVDTRVDPGVPLNYLSYVIVDVSSLVPAGATAVAFNVTATGQTSSGYLNVAPEGTIIGSSTINWSRPSETIANGHVTKLSLENRFVVLMEGGGTTHVVLDITGYFAPPGTPNATLYAPANRRVYDSRTTNNPLQPGATRVVNINTGGSAQPVAPTAASVNVTVTGTTGSGVLTAAKDASTATSTINWTAPGQTVANAVITDVAANGNFTLTNNGKTSAHVIVDLTGTFAPTANGAMGAQFYARNPDRSYDSRFDPAGRLLAGQSRTTLNPVPDDAVAVALNATVTDTRGTGYLSVTPPGPGVPTTSTVNWFVSPTTRANGSIIASDDGQTRAYVGGSYSTQYLYDLAGYFR